MTTVICRVCRIEASGSREWCEQWRDAHAQTHGHPVYLRDF